MTTIRAVVVDPEAPDRLAFRDVTPRHQPPTKPSCDSPHSPSTAAKCAASAWPQLAGGPAGTSPAPSRKPPLTAPDPKSAPASSACYQPPPGPNSSPSRPFPSPPSPTKYRSPRLPPSPSLA